MARTALLFLALTGLLSAQPATVLLDDPRLATFRLNARTPEAATVDSSGGRVQLRLTAPSGRAGGVSLSAPIADRIEAGDTLLLTFAVRAAGGKDAELQVSFEPGVSRFSRPLNMPADAPAEWKTYQYPFAPRRAYSTGQARLVFVPGAGPSVIEIRDVRLVNYKATKRPWELPITRTSYAGMEPGAAWRAAAGERIERIRKSDVEIVVKDAKGAPVRDAQVEVEQRKHAFGFGTAVSDTAIRGIRLNAQDSERYRDSVRSLFNKAVIENALKWPSWANENAHPGILQAVQQLQDAGLEVRGHCLVWPSWQWNSVPATLAAKNDPEQLARAILSHVEDEAAALRGKVVEWDVINEPFSNHDFMDLLGRQAMVDWFKAARRADPNAKLYINDYEILSGNDRKHQDHYFETIRYLIDSGAEVNGIGLQSHFPSRVTPPEEVLRRLDRFGSFGRDLQITEFDIDTIDEQTQAYYTRDFMTAVFSHPRITGFMMWGFWERNHWKPDGAMIRSDWSLKPNALAYKDLVFNRWWTRASGKTGREGSFRTRAFLGDYIVRVSARGKSVEQKVRVKRENPQIAITLGQ